MRIQEVSLDGFFENEIVANIVMIVVAISSNLMEGNYGEDLDEL
jgi:hypothetical protein